MEPEHPGSAASRLAADESTPTAPPDAPPSTDGPQARRVHLRLVEGPGGHGRKHPVRAATMSLKEMRRDVRDAPAFADPIDPAVLAARPRTREQCVDGPRPCPWVSCAHHLYLDVADNGSVKLNFPDLDVDEIPETCAWDVADRTRSSGEEATLEDVGAAMNLTRERVRQIETKAFAKIKMEHGMELRELLTGRMDDGDCGAPAESSEDEWDALLADVVRTYG